MIELTESFTIARQMNESIVGKEISLVKLQASPHKFAFFSDEPEVYGVLVGKQIETVIPWAGYLELEIENLQLLLSEDLQIRYIPEEKLIPQKHQLLLGFSDQTFLVCTVKMYGFIGLYMNHLIDSPYYQAAITRPSPLSPEFDEVYFDQLIKSASPKLSAKAFLATEQRIPGLGNGLLQDILFFSGIHPKRKISSFSAADSSRLYDVIKIQTKKIAAAGGRDTEKDLYGNPGGYHTALSSKTWKAPCPVCGGVITKQAYLGGSVYFCSFCQPLD